jgi:hypothetical protein
MAKNLDSIMMWVANEESWYNRVMRLYDRWVDEGDSWEATYAETKEADPLIRSIAEEIQESQAEASDHEKYTEADIQEAIAETMEDFEQYREDEIAERQKKAAAKPKPRKPMDQATVEYTKKMDQLLVQLGIRMLPDIVDHPVNMTEADARQAAIDYLVRFMPASKAKIRHALDTGDEHLNTIKPRLWDEKAEEFNYKRFRLPQGYRLTLRDAVGLLKHVATWHYA